MARILVIEDEADIRQVLDYNLKSVIAILGAGPLIQAMMA